MSRLRRMKNEIFTIYLAGSIRGKNAGDVIKFFNANQKYIEDRFKEANIPVKILSPIRGKHCDDEGKEWTSQYSLHEIIERDENDVRNSDMILIQTGDEPSDGTWFEFGLAHYVCKIPVVMVAPLRKEGKKKSWSNHKATYIGDSLKDAVDWILEYWMV